MCKKNGHISHALYPPKESTCQMTLMSKDEWAFLEGKKVEEVELEERRAAKLVPILLPGILTPDLY